MNTTATATRYAIVRTRSFYGSPDKRDRHEGPEATWATLAEAQQEIATQHSGPYYQSHNEYGRAEYRAVRVDRLPAYLA